MISPLLKTKLFIPLTQPKLISRRNLIERLDKGLHQKLTLISAPAGFGKTTLVRDWVNDRAESTAWLSLDEGDNDPIRFLAYLVAALQTVDPDLGKSILEILQSPQIPPVEVMLTSLINELAVISTNIILVLDDFHLIESQSIHDMLTFFLNHLPPQTHLVIATREDPYLPITRLRGRGQLNELRAIDLRFTPSESAEFLNKLMKLELTEEEITALEARTEGWIAGLQLAAISLQGSKDSTEIIKSFTGSHRLVLDYLIEEVLGQQSENIQNFLLQTAILDRLTGSLCNALTSQDNGQQTLELLEHANLFIIPLDEERRWYRYHHLFSDLLLQRLRQTQSGQIPALYLEASDWCQLNHFNDEAINYALRGGHFERAARLIEPIAEKTWVQGEDTKLRRWLDGLPEEIVFSKPQLCVFHSWSLCITGQMDAADKTMQILENIIDSSKKQFLETELQKEKTILIAEWEKIRGRAAVVRAFMCSFQGNFTAMIKYANLALELLPESDLSWRSTAANTLGDAYDIKGQISRAYQVRIETLEMSKAAGNIFQIMIANLKLAILYRHLGQLNQVIKICQEQFDFINESGYSQTIIAGSIMAVWGEALAEMNDLEAAFRLTQKGRGLTEHGGDIALIGTIYICLIRVMFSMGNLDAAENTILDMEKIDRENNIPPWITNQMAAWKARIFLAKNELDSAIHWAEEHRLALDDDLSVLKETEYIVLARIFIAQERFDEASNLLQKLLLAAETDGRTSKSIEILMLQTLAFKGLGETVQAQNALHRTLTLAEQGGFKRIFLDEGLRMRNLLKEVKVENGRTEQYIYLLLAAFENNKPVPKPSQQALIEPLSNRELEVLQLIADGLSNQQIGSHLYLSINTIKGHSRNIFGKLGVNNRTQAAAKARSLGILPEG